MMDCRVKPGNDEQTPLRHLEIVEETSDLAGEQLGAAGEILDRLGHVVGGSRCLFGGACDCGGVGEHVAGAVRSALRVAGDLAGGGILLLDGAGELGGDTADLGRRPLGTGRGLRFF